MEARDRIIVALDASTMNEAVNIAKELGPHVGALKIGMEIMNSEGAPQVTSAVSRYGKVFFDGKFKDIPNTVSRASKAVARLGVWMFNVHCLGGVTMMAQAKAAVHEEAKRVGLKPPLTIGVTILTSFDVKAINELGFEHVRDEAELRKLVVRLALLAKQAGLDGVVASPLEIEAIRAACGKDFLIVTPGVRPVWAAANDQKRIMTPEEAIKAGADYIVIGRPITNPPKEVGSPLAAVEKIVEELRQAVN